MELLLIKKEIVSKFLKHKVLVNRDVLTKLNEPGVAQEWYDELQKGTTPSQLLKPEITSTSNFSNSTIPTVKIVWEYEEIHKKRTVQDFTDYFNARYRALQKI